ncbi:right-handed parallel beta-helix repeat-containing protein [Bacillus sp. ISL-40]|nr:right-handed parallel beta-helix repeat-containing protein [Bacillus sp. ISL-40]MBT2721975.1 right-handed parallel beta-helix repeat-containing protein [Bacillus sp. ISL-46]MBT2741676.1 right-handed parallel beta-helix repeat-containing protein [Bacillus sp. ISL-77]
MADTNIQGINNAIQYAFSNGYDGVLLPKGQYSLCYPREIKMLSNMTFNLNGSTLKVIYDSDRKSPFDNRTTRDFYNFVGNSILFENVLNAHLINGTIIGCRDDRSFSNVTAERKVESSYGVVFRKSTRYCTIKNCIVRDYMGDNITFSSSAIRELAEFNMNLTLNSLDYNTGQLVSSTNSLTTGFINIPTDAEFSSFLIAGAGYSRLTTLINKDVDVFFYKADNSFIGVLKKKKIYTNISIPLNAAKMRMVFSGETNPSKNLQITLKFGLIPHHNVVEYNELYNGHRGGISLGGSYNVVQHNVIRDNGKGSNSFLDGKPIFSDPTRYAINQEDSYGDNCVIRNNLIYGCNHGILAGCYSIQIENNHIYNVDSIGINLYSLLYANVRGNIIYNCPTSIGIMNSNFGNAYVNISENSIQGGNMSFNVNDSYQLNVTDNNFIDVSNINMGTSNINNTFRNNRIKYANISGAPALIANKIESCIFDSTTVRDLTLKVYQQIGCTFNNLKITIQTLNGTTKSEKVTIENCEYTNSTLINLILGTKDRGVFISKSRFTDTVIKVGNINTPGFPATIVLEECQLTASAVNYLFATDLNQPSGLIKLEKCTIEISNSTFSHLIHHDKTTLKAVFTLFLKDCKFKFTGTTPLNLIYYNSINPMIKFISADNLFTNINLPNEDPNIYVGYDTVNTYKANVILQTDGDGYSTTINHNLNTLEPYVLSVSSASKIVQSIISIIDKNTIFITDKENTNLKVTVKKL